MNIEKIKQNLYFCVFAFIVIFYVYILTISFTKGHEEVHKKIFEDYGLENISIDINYLTSEGTTKATDINHSCNELCYLSHNINEAIAYNLHPYFFGIQCILTVIAMILFRIGQLLAYKVNNQNGEFA